MTINNINIFGDKTTLYLNNGATIEAVGSKTSGNCKPVICEDNGEVYTSVFDAAQKNGTSPTNMSMHLRGGTKKCKGKKFRYLTDRDDSIDAMAFNLRRLQTANAELESDAMKWREYQAQLEAERKAKEKRDKAIFRMKERIEKHEAKLAREAEIIETLKEELERLESESL